MTNFSLMVSTLKQNIARAVVGKDDVVELMLTALLCEGHVLIEDVPGVGKTTMALAFSKALGLRYNRMQFTPDVLPSDVTGFSLYNKAVGKMEYQPGAVLCNLFLADELNRATSRTQAALLEAMEEGQVTVDGVTHALPRPFIVIATQNPAGASGTQLLPDSQLDRFMVKLSLGYPEPQDELRMLRRKQKGNPLDGVQQALDKAGLAALRAQYPSVDFGSLDVQLANVKDEDWENNWKQYYQPLPIGEKLLVVPEWLHPENPENRVEVLLDPGMIFGTGAHASTQMCMRELERAIQGGERVLDLGSGSGILPITAVLLGAAHATGVDIDPKAEDIARENAAINQIFSDRFTAVTGDVIGDRAMMESLRGHYDVVLANIVADVIIPLSRVVPEFLQEDSVFICSGILNTRLAEVLAALEQNGLQIISTEQQEDWCRVTAALPEA